jgi:hypothetical protein
MVSKIKLVAFFLLFFANGSSQGKSEWVVFAGAQTTSAKYRIFDFKQPTGNKYGAMGGVALMIPFENRLHFFPSIYYSKKGYTVELNRPSSPPDSSAINNNTDIHTIEIAPMFHINLGKNEAHPFVRIGVAIDFAFAGNEKFDKTGGSVSRPMIFSFGDYGRFTNSANIHLGYQFSKGLHLFAFYNHGMGNMNNSDGGPNIVHRIGGISLGWHFKRNPLVFDTRVKE